jgi:TonB family protein
VEPEFSANSKESFVEGVVKVSTVVTTQETVSDCQIIRGLKAEEDRTALKAVKLWRFQPGTKGGKPVNVRVWKLKDVQDKTRSEQDRFRRYYSARDIVENYKSDLHSKTARRVNQELEALRLPTLSSVKDEFLRLADGRAN